MLPKNPKVIPIKAVKNELKLMQYVTMFNSKIDIKEFKRLLWNSCSLDEGTVVNFREMRELDIIRYSSMFLIRTFPEGRRIDSSNYDPTRTLHTIQRPSISGLTSSH